MTWLGYISNPRYILNYFSFPLRVRDSAGFYCICSNSSHIFAATLVDTHIFVSPTHTFEAAVCTPYDYSKERRLQISFHSTFTVNVTRVVQLKMHARCGIRPPCLLQLSDWTCWEEDSPNHLSDLSYVQAIYWIYIYTEPIKLPTLYDHRRDSFASVTRYSIPATISAFSFLLI